LELVDQSQKLVGQPRQRRSGFPVAPVSFGCFSHRDYVRRAHVHHPFATIFADGQIARGVDFPSRASAVRLAAFLAEHHEGATGHLQTCLEDLGEMLVAPSLGSGESAPQARRL